MLPDGLQLTRKGRLLLDGFDIAFRDELFRECLTQGLVIDCELDPALGRPVSARFTDITPKGVILEGIEEPLATSEIRSIRLRAGCVQVDRLAALMDGHHRVLWKPMLESIQHRDADQEFERFAKVKGLVAGGAAISGTFEYRGLRIGPIAALAFGSNANARPEVVKYLIDRGADPEPRVEPESMLEFLGGAFSTEMLRAYLAAAFHHKKFEIPRADVMAAAESLRAKKRTDAAEIIEAMSGLKKYRH